MKSSIIADTGYWLALANSKDQYHKMAIQSSEVYTDPLITTWPVLTETCHLLTRAIGSHAQNQFIQCLVDGAFTIFQMDQGHAIRIRQLMRQYETLPMDLADASLVILAEHLGHGRIFSTDSRDFNTYRWKNHHPFENLLLYC